MQFLIVYYDSYYPALERNHIPCNVLLCAKMDTVANNAVQPDGIVVFII